MSESKLKKDLVVSVTLTPSQRVALNSIMNLITRCGVCGAVSTQGDNELQIKRFNQVMTDLDLESIDDLSRTDQMDMSKDNTTKVSYSLKLEAARHLQSVLDKKLRFSAGGPYLLDPLVKSLEAQVPKSAAEMDAEATAEEKPAPAKFLVELSPEEKEILLQAFFNQTLCLKCGVITDGPEDRKTVGLFASSFIALQLDKLFDKTMDELNVIRKEAPTVDVILDLDQANYLHSLLFRRVGLVPKGPRKLARFLKVIEEIKGATYERKLEVNGEKTIPSVASGSIDGMRSDNAV